MNPRLNLLSIVTGFIMVSCLMIQEADACNRCGLFGRACRFQTVHYSPIQKYVAPIAYNQPDVFVVQNNYPQPLVGQGSSLVSSVGGSYQSLVLPLLDPNRYFSQELQLLRAANDTNALRNERSAALFQRALELQAPAQERLAAGQAAAMVLTAAGLNPSGGGVNQSQAVVINRDAQGRIQVLPLSQGEIAKLSTGNSKAAYPPAPTSQMGDPSAQQAPPPAPSAYPALTQFCFKCHGLELAQPKGGFFIGNDPNVAKTLKQEFFEVVQLVKNGEMPPATYNPQPTKEDRIAILNEIESLIIGVNSEQSQPEE